MRDKPTTIKEVIEKMEVCSRELSLSAIFYGHKAFEYLLRQRRLKPRIQIIRVYNYGRAKDPHYVVTRNGKLEVIITEEQDREKPKIVDPKTVLSMKNAPHGWEPTGDYWCRRL